MKKKLFLYTLLISLVYVSFYAISRKLIFMPKGGAGKPNYTGSLLSVPNGSRKAIGYFTKSGKKLVVLFHGQHATIQSIAPLSLKFIQSGYSLLSVEYPGYGLASKYYSSESNIYSDSEAIIRHVQKTEGFSKTDTYLVGYSLGTGVATEMLYKNMGDRALLLAPYTSIPDIASHRYVSILPHLVIWDRFDSLSKAGKVKQKVLIVHGKKDTVVPYSMAEQLNLKFVNAQLITVPKGNHSATYLLKGNTWTSIQKFLSE